jgi:malate dehydrogenase
MKVVLIGGAGGVGSSVAFSLLTSRFDYEVVLVDTRPEMIVSHVMDLENAVALGGADVQVRGGTVEDALNADIVVLCAAVPLRLNTSRSVYLAENLKVVAQTVAPLRDPAFTGVVLMLTNPVDPLLTWVYRQEWLPRQRLVGYTLNDSLRLRTGAAAALGVHPREVDGWVIGEHGAGQVPLYSRLTVRGEPVVLSDVQHKAAQEYIENWYVRHVALNSGRTSTWASGLGAARMIEAMSADDGAMLPASVALEGEYGVNGICLGVPTVLGRRGVDQIVEWELAPDELDGLRAAARSIESAVADLDGLSA